MPEKAKFIFFGTPDVASETLETLKQAGYTPSLIVTSPDKPKGRKMVITPPPVKMWAIENNVPYIQPEKLESEAEATITTSSQPVDFFIVVAYGKMIPEKILNTPRLGAVNIHYSLLPKYRGASPVESAILNGDSVTGVTLQQMEYKMDSGPAIAREKVIILPDEKAPDLRKRLIKAGGELLVKTLPKFVSGKIRAIPQNEIDATYCKKIKKEDGLIDLTESPVVNFNKFRAYAFWPRIFFFKNGKRMIITEARLENHKFIIEKIIPENGKEMNYKN